MSTADNPEICGTCFVTKNIGFTDDCLHIECPYKNDKPLALVDKDTSEADNAIACEHGILKGNFCNQCGKFNDSQKRNEPLFTRQQVVAEIMACEDLCIMSMHTFRGKRCLGSALKTESEVIALLDEGS